MTYLSQLDPTQMPIVGPNEAPSDLRRRVIEVSKNEHVREARAEKYIEVESRNGYVQFPRTNTRLATDKDLVLFAGTDDHQFKEFVEGPVDKVIRTLREGDGEPWTHTSASFGLGGPKLPAYRLTGLGNDVVSCCRQYHDRWSIAYDSHVFRPAVAVILRALRRFALPIGQEAVGVKAITHSSELARLLNRLVRFVRRVLGSWKFINAENDYRKQAQKNFNSARELIYYWAERRSRLLLLRIDLYYQPYYESEKANREIHNFLRWLRGNACKRNVLPGYLGFIIKRENGIVRGMHWHLMVICDGNLQRSAGYLSQQLGEMWAKRTGQGPGSYYNCYADRAKYEFNGLGLLNLDDWEKMAGLRAALYYMTKQDCVLKATNDKVKNFWRSPVRREAGKKRGRRRFEDESLKLLKRMLGGKRSKYPPGFGLGKRLEA